MRCGWQQKTRHYEAGQIQVFKRAEVRYKSFRWGLYLYTYVRVCVYIHIH